MQEKTMRRSLNNSVPLGELVTTVFDDAAQYSNDPREVSRLAVQAVAHMLRHTQRTSVTMPPPTQCAKTTTLLRSAYGEKR